MWRRRNQWRAGAYTRVFLKKSLEGHDNCCCDVSTHTCVLQNKSMKKSFGTHMCVDPLRRFLTLAEGWPTNCCCEHTHTCVLQNKSMKKSLEGFEHSTTLADQLLLRAHNMRVAEEANEKPMKKSFEGFEHSTTLADQLLL